MASASLCATSSECTAGQPYVFWPESAYLMDPGLDLHMSMGERTLRINSSSILCSERQLPRSDPAGLLISVRLRLDWVAGDNLMTGRNCKGTRHILADRLHAIRGA